MSTTEPKNIFLTEGSADEDGFGDSDQGAEELGIEGSPAAEELAESEEEEDTAY